MGNVVKIKNFDDVNETIEQFIENLDFERIHNVMTMLDWKWLSHPPHDVPSIEVLKESVRHYMKECANGALKKLEAKPGKKKVSYETGTGGFFYRTWAYRDTPKIYFEVTFAITDWNNFD